MPGQHGANPTRTLLCMSRPPHVSARPRIPSRKGHGPTRRRGPLAPSKPIYPWASTNTALCIRPVSHRSLVSSRDGKSGLMILKRTDSSNSALPPLPTGLAADPCCALFPRLPGYPTKQSSTTSGEPGSRPGRTGRWRAVLRREWTALALWGTRH
ncbi:hypothetical protein BGZ61DRAFT_439694 [Ilyonectria robusta]|uniref:uncharacterized protein n=1 Tax=Ilyonectria robusta TaxID=1079257 RepID=UPI001E8CD153|nr:uncharacterized protein BGZ61DRAFT_439694 [Ilyonectria robusta]KAH8738165.1 hypothetical protein BGZ61DRAFT_439694 [Ilyonectria robusta]